MPSLGKFKPKTSQILAGTATALLLLAVAGGGAAAATPRPANTPRPSVAQVATPAQTGKPLAAPAPTAAPTPTLTPAPTVSGGKVTWMIGSFGNERFDYTVAANGGHDYGRQIHGFLLSSDFKDARRVMIPGIAREWEISSHGLTWTLTIRKGVKFHDGTEVTAEDVSWTLRHGIGPQAKDYALAISIIPWVWGRGC